MLSDILLIGTYRPLIHTLGRALAASVTISPHAKITGGPLTTSGPKWHQRLLRFFTPRKKNPPPPSDGFSNYQFQELLDLLAQAGISLPEDPVQRFNARVLMGDKTVFSEEEIAVFDNSVRYSPRLGRRTVQIWVARSTGRIVSYGADVDPETMSRKGLERVDLESFGVPDWFRKEFIEVAKTPDTHVPGMSQKLTDELFAFMDGSRNQLDQRVFENLKNMLQTSRDETRVLRHCFRSFIERATHPSFETLIGLPIEVHGIPQ